jgi:hypothetical protein
VSACDQFRDAVAIDHVMLSQMCIDHRNTCPECAEYLDMIAYIDMHGPAATQYVVSDAFAQRLLQSIDDYAPVSAHRPIESPQGRVSAILGLTALLCGIVMMLLFSVGAVLAGIPQLRALLPDVSVIQHYVQQYGQSSTILLLAQTLHAQTIWMIVIVIVWLIVSNSAKQRQGGVINQHIS